MSPSRSWRSRIDPADVVRTVAEFGATRPLPGGITAALAAEAILADPVAVHPVDLVPVPFSSRGKGMVGYLGVEAGRVGCVDVVPVGPGDFVHGHDNAIFGRWNALVAARRSGVCETFAAHGGEIIPGRLADHIQRLRDGRSFPVQVDMDISMACPSACTFCFSAGYRAGRSDGRLMSESLLRGLIEQWAEVGVRVIRFDGGGDPLTHPALPAAITLCAKHDLTTAVLTAGDLLPRVDLDAFVEAGTYVRVSLNAAVDRTRNLLHRQRTERFGVERIFAAVGALAERRASRWGGQSRVRMPIGATSMIHPVNAAETVAIARRAKEVGFDHLSFRVILGAAHRVRFDEPARHALAESFAEIESEVADEDFLVFLPTRELTDTGYVPARYFDRCRASVHRALVEVGPSPDRAAVVPCGRYRGQGFAGGPEPVVFDYLGESDTIAERWMNPRMVNLLDTFPRSCGDCIDRSANTFLQRVDDNLREDKDTAFFPFRSDAPLDGSPHA